MVSCIAPDQGNQPRRGQTGGRTLRGVEGEDRPILDASDTQERQSNHHMAKPFVNHFNFSFFLVS